MATLDFYKSDGTQVKLSLVEDPANPGQYLPKSNGDLLLGTPGTGEPAHAGGSTGVIGWLRDILANGASLLAKIAAFGTSSAPSADVLSVQYPNTYVGKATLGALNAALTVDTLVACQIAFTSDQVMPGGMTFVIEGTNANAASPVWSALRFFSEIGGALYVASSGATMGVGGKFIVSCAGMTQVRVRITEYSSGSWEVLAHRVYLPSFSTNISMPTNTSATPLFTVDSNAVYYTDTTTPLAANATFTGSTRAMLEGNNFFNAYFRSDTSGASFQIEVSTNNVNWRLGLPLVSSTANSPSNQSMRRTTSFYRVVCVAGAAAQSVLNIHSSQTPV